MMLVLNSLVVIAKSESFSGTMYYRVLDGSSNGKYYSFDGNKTITLSGGVKVIETSNFGGSANTTYICCYEKTGLGGGRKICEASTVATNDGEWHNFYNTGKTINTSDKYYIYCYKVNDDGYDVSISGSLSTN